MNLEALSLKFTRDGERLRPSEHILLAFCRPTKAPPLSVATPKYTLENALNYARLMVPDFPARVRGKSVLDYGCGPGWQAVAMRLAGADRVHGIDINDEWLEAGRVLAASAGASRVSFGKDVDSDGYDVVISLGSMEHFRDPQKELARMAAFARKELIISFAEPWYSPYGTHLNGTTKLPWLKFFFSERTIMNVRNLYPDGSDGATKFEDIRGGLNKMTVRRFKKLVYSVPGIRVEYLRLRAVKGLPIITTIPVLREMFTSALTCILRPR